jgi:hypothetical protein
MHAVAVAAAAATAAFAGAHNLGKLMLVAQNHC